MVRLLLDRGADPTIVDSSQETPLSTAADKGHLEVVKMLIEDGRVHNDVNRADCHDETALMKAFSGGHCEIVRLLLEMGAEPKDTDIKYLYSAPGCVKGVNRFRGCIRLIQVRLEIPTPLATAMTVMTITA
jgi:ankyrin repeat protein